MNILFSKKIYYFPFLKIFLFIFQETQPLYSFEHNSDYVFDVSWSPIHPALFACVDGLGNFDLWNLNCDTEVCSLNISHTMY